MKKLSMIGVTLAVALMFVSALASAGVLLDQSNLDRVGPGYFNSESGSPPFGSTWFTLNDMTLGTDATVTDITVYFSATDPAFAQGIFQGYVNIFPKSGTMPGAGDDPTVATAVPVTVTTITGSGDPYTEVKASGLGISLTAGDYWIGLTPIAPAGPFGPEIHIASLTKIGDDSASYDKFGFPAPMWFVFNPGVDASILVNGAAIVPVESSSWGAVKSLYEGQ